MDTARLNAPVLDTARLKIFGFSMVRNEADIMSAFVRQAIEMFDRFVFIDIMSTDGTRELLKQTEKEHSNIVVYECRTKEKYQAAMMNFLAREALRLGADWLFFLDADEFIPAESRHELESYLTLFGGEVMSMPWLNLIPSSYCDFLSFNYDQRFYWSGRTSAFCKIAVSSLYFHSHSDAYINEGNHTISLYQNGPLAPQHFGMPLLHVPVRSRERLKYKLSNSLRFLSSKHNSENGEGSHVSSILDVIEGEQTSKEYLNAIATDYGRSDHELEAVDPQRLDWPEKLLPRYLVTTQGARPQALSLGATLSADSAVQWRDSGYVRDSPVTAALDGDELRIVAQPISGRLQPRYGRFQALAPIVESALPQFDPNSLPKLLADALAVSLLPIKFETFSAWSRLIPVLFALFPIVRPRRYVELGVHNGMSFFAACQVSEHVKTNTECVAIDSWIGDPHASFHSSTVFEEFKQNLQTNYPGAFFIQGMFSHAVDLFENGSIDLLHIDGYHTYEAVKADFEDWLCKMSDIGIVLFHDINVHERNFGVWQLWQELCDRHTGLSFMHSHGLGLLYVGRDDSAIASGFRWLKNNPAYFSVLQKYFEVLGENSIGHGRTKSDVALNAEGISEEKDRRLNTYIRRLGLDDELIVIPINRELGGSIDHVVVVTKALKRLTRGLRIRWFLLWPFSARRRKYRKQLKIIKYLRTHIRAPRAGGVHDGGSS
jgi:hypothetical protein